MNTQDIQSKIESLTGLKISVKKGKGSMKGYMIFWPQFQNGIYPTIPFEYTIELRELLKEFSTVKNPLFVSVTEVCVYGVEGEAVKHKRESKPKPIEDMNVKQWGSKNSQVRLDKAIRRHGEKLRKEGRIY